MGFATQPLNPLAADLFDFDGGFLNSEVFRRLTVSTSSFFEGIERVHALDDLAKEGVFAVEVRGRYECDEELASVGAGASVGHAEQAGPVMLNRRRELAIVLVARSSGSPA